MWLFALFDLPVLKKEDRRQYARFRKHLLRQGFFMLQFSVYARHGVSEEAVDAVRRTVRAALPPRGQVRLMAVTDHQFGRMEVFYGKKKTKVEEAPAQYILF